MLMNESGHTPTILGVLFGFPPFLLNLCVAFWMKKPVVRGVVKSFGYTGFARFD